jgi:hypothetical protein
MRKLTEIDCTNICDDYLIGLSYNLLSEKYNICTWSIGNVLKKNIYTFQVNSKSDIELIENILYTSSNDYYLKRKKEKFK